MKAISFPVILVFLFIALGCSDDTTSPPSNPAYNGDDTTDFHDTDTVTIKFKTIWIKISPPYGRDSTVQYLRLCEGYEFGEGRYDRIFKIEQIIDSVHVRLYFDLDYVDRCYMISDSPYIILSTIEECFDRKNWAPESYVIHYHLNIEE